MLILFYGTAQRSAFAALWAQLLDGAIVLFINLVSVKLCDWSLLQERWDSAASRSHCARERIWQSI